MEASPYYIPMKEKEKDSKYLGSFHGAEIDYQAEYIEARRLMGLKSTDMDQLMEAVTLLYLNCPESCHPHYLALLEEIQMRQELIALGSLNSLIRSIDEQD